MSIFSTIRRFIGEAAADVRFGGQSDGVCLHVAFGSRVPRVGAARAAVREVDGDRLLNIARFVRRRGLPVDAWCISGLSFWPGGSRALASWLTRFSEAVAPTPVVVVANDLTRRNRRRLRGHLARSGCITPP